MNLALIKSKLRKNWPLILACYPLLSLALLYLFVVRARLHLGFWPTYGQPDPKTLGFTVHHQLVWLSWQGMVLVAVLVIALAANDWRLARYRRTWLGVGLLVFSILLVMLLSWLDPGDFMTWFVD